MAILKVYYKKFIDGNERSVICNRADNWILADVTARKADLPSRFKADADNNIDIAKEIVVKDSGDDSINLKEVYTKGKSTVTWHFRRNNFPAYEVSFL